MSTDAMVILSIACAVAIIVGVYVLVTYNDLTRRWQRLLALAADVRVARRRRQGIKADMARHLGHVQHHERRVANSGSRRGRGSGKWVSDNFNGWPALQTADLTGTGMSQDAESHNIEQAARLRLHAEAELYNQRVLRFPTRIVARWFGFRPWRFKTNGGRRFRRR